MILKSTNPLCLTCRHALVTHGRSWRCTRCHFSCPKQQHLFRDARSEHKALHNAWCLACRVPMRKRGDCFGCEVCHTHVQVQPKRLLAVHHPCCWACRHVLTVCKGGLFWRCNFCNYTIAVHRAKPVNKSPFVTHLPQSDNPCCLRCRVPMVRHGTGRQKYFACTECNLTVFRTGVSLGRHPRNTFVEISARSAGGPQRFADTWYVHPWCIRCRRRMRRCSNNHGIKSYQCTNCYNTVKHVYTKNATAFARDQKIVALLKAGYLDVDIWRKLRCSPYTVKALRATVLDPARCACGQLKHHRRLCPKTQAWRELVKQQRTEFDTLISQINHSMPFNLPAEMRDDIRAQMLYEIVAHAKQIVSNPSKQIRAYNKLFPYGRDISLDEPNSKLAATLEG